MDRKRKILSTIAFGFLISTLLMGISVASAQQSSRHTDCHSNDDDDAHIRRNGIKLKTYRETIEKIVPASSGTLIKVDPGSFGGITVTGWDREEIKLVAQKKAAAITDEEARELASQVQIVTEEKSRTIDIHAEGPEKQEDTFWSVCFDLLVPRRSNLDLRTAFGGISIEEVSGDMRFTTKFGGLALSKVSGTVVGQTHFGGVDLELDGDRWEGERLDVTTKFGGITARLPKDYSATLEVGTSFGSLDSDFPITVQGRLGWAKRIKASLGSGGAPIRLVTEFGGISIKER
jgi:hypothetical protein